MCQFSQENSKKSLVCIRQKKEKLTWEQIARFQLTKWPLGHEPLP